jgi:hypothetical protein
MNFSDTYINSQFVKKMLEAIPESDRERFIEVLRQSIAQYDGLVSVSGNSEIFDALHVGSEIPKEGGRRPPRR